MRAAFAAVVLVALARTAAADPVTDALARARRSGKPVVVEFRADWCGPCVAFERHVLSRDEVQQALGRVEFVRVDVDDADSASIQRAYRVDSIPTFLVLDAAGHVVQRVEGIAQLVGRGAFVAFLERLTRTPRSAVEHAALVRAIEHEVAAVRAAPGARASTHPLSRALLSGMLAPDDAAELFSLHLGAIDDATTAALAAYVALAARDRIGAIQAGRIAVELAPGREVAHTALAYARAESGLGYAIREYLTACSAMSEGSLDRERCEAVLERLMTGEASVVTRLLRQAGQLYVRGVLSPGEANRTVQGGMERLAERALTEPEDALRSKLRADQEQRQRETLAGYTRPVRAVASLRFDADPGRAFAGARAILPLFRRIEVQPTALVHGEVGADSDADAAYDGAAMIGFSVGGAIGIYGGIGINDPGSGVRPSMGVPIELALSLAGPRFGVEGFARTTWTSWSRDERSNGSENAPGGADELSLGLAARVPGALGRGALIGVRYDEVLGERLVGLWLGADILPR